ncbi:MAG: hypothetical protein MUF54_14775 [Polyangiaceae bacterium]|jgi:hypothetical protein|nr:hypothetical protein [Polyangiaceae bacterium]
MASSANDLCTWKDLVVTRVGNKRSVSPAKRLWVLRQWRDSGYPPQGFTVSWPPGKKRVRMDGLGDE